MLNDREHEIPPLRFAAVGMTGGVARPFGFGGKDGGVLGHFGFGGNHGGMAGHFGFGGNDGGAGKNGLYCQDE